MVFDHCIDSTAARSSIDATPGKISKSEMKKLKKKEYKKRQKDGKNKVVSSAYRCHPQAIQLQKDLEGVFPFCNDISNIAADGGFKPHLSLGQFTAREVDSFMTEFKDQWVDFEFTVSEVCLISRADFDDPFHVRFRVPLGGK